MATIFGTGAAERIDGTAGDDSIRGFAGDDTLVGSGGADTLVGGQGNDRYFVDSTSDLVREASGQGFDIIYATSDFIVSEANEIEGLRALGADDIDLVYTGETNISMAGNVGNNLLHGGNGNDTLSGREGNDDLAGGDGADRLIGGSGNDLLRGGLGEDTMSGGDGDDVYRVRDTSDVVVEGSGAGYDTVLTTVSFSLGNAQEIETLRALTSADVQLDGNDFSNTIIGSSGNDSISGGGGDDILRGNSGADELTGGSGNDFMIGGIGNDIFFFSGTSGSDRIQDFDLTADQLHFSGVSGVSELAFEYVAAGENTMITHNVDNSVLLVGISSEDAAALAATFVFA